MNDFKISFAVGLSLNRTRGLAFGLADVAVRTGSRSQGRLVEWICGRWVIKTIITDFSIDFLLTWN